MSLRSAYHRVVVLAGLQEEALQIPGLGHGQQGWMVGALAQAAEQPEPYPGVAGGAPHRLLERALAHVVRARKGGEDSAGLEQPGGTEVDLLVAAEGAR